MKSLKIIFSFFARCSKAFKSIGLAFWAVLLFLIVVVLAILSATWPTSAQMSARVKTQIWTLDLAPNDEVPNYLSGNVNVFEDVGLNCLKNQYVVDFVDQSKSSLRFIFLENGDNGYSVFIESDNLGNVYGTLSCRDHENKTHELTEGLTLYYSFDNDTKIFNDSSLNFVAVGAVKLGALPTDGQQAFPRLLESGVVVSSSLSWPIQSSRIVTKTELYGGDEVRFFESLSTNSKARSKVISKYDKNKGLFDLVVHSEAQRAVVNQYGGFSSFTVNSAPSMWARIQAQPLWAILVLLLTALFNVYSVLSKSHQLQFKSRKGKI